MSQRQEALPEDPNGHYRIKPRFPHTRWYYLRELSKIVKSAIEVVKAQGAGRQLVVADYGCGTKPYRSYFSDDNFQYLGIDLAWNPHADIVLKEDGTIDQADGTMDVVLSTQVLEHVEDPSLYLNESYRVLKPGGHLILTTHGYWMFHPDPTDYWRWTSTGLRKIVRQANFEVIHFEGILGRMSMGLQLFQDGLMYKFPSGFRPVVGFFSSTVDLHF